jgi:NTE family protein
MPDADLVLEGGGVRGLGTAGAVIRLLEAGYTFRRVAGTSVGAVAAAFVASGMDAARFRRVIEEVDLHRIPDRFPPGVPLLSEGLALLSRRGSYQGAWIHAWIKDVLAEAGVTTFADLRRKDGGDCADLPEDRKYRLVVMATDVTRGRLLRLPWDYRHYHLEPDDQPVADAVRMSLSIPFYFAPCALTDPTTGRSSVIVDGGVLSNFPVDIFDRTDGRAPRWPTFGVRIIPDLPEGMAELFPGPAVAMSPSLLLLQQVVTTAVVGHDQTQLDRPGIRDRTIRVDTPGIGITDFHLPKDKRAAAVAQGWTAADDFLRRLRPPTAAESPVGAARASARQGPGAVQPRP